MFTSWIRSPVGWLLMGAHFGSLVSLGQHYLEPIIKRLADVKVFFHSYANLDFLLGMFTMEDNPVVHCGIIVCYVLAMGLLFLFLIQQLVRSSDVSASLAKNGSTVVVIDGPIGVGKSTVLGALEKRRPEMYAAIPEPTDLWTNWEGRNLLGEYYDDGDALLFQLVVLLTRLEQWQHAINTATSPVLLVERHPLLDRHVFARSKLDTAQFALYDKVYRAIEDQFIRPKLHVHLRASPKTCHQRCRQRDRAEEANLPLDFFSTHCEAYERARADTDVINGSELHVSVDTEIGSAQCLAAVDNVITSVLSSN